MLQERHAHVPGATPIPYLKRHALDTGHEQQTEGNDPLDFWDHGNQKVEGMHWLRAATVLIYVCPSGSLLTVVPPNCLHFGGQILTFALQVHGSYPV